MAVTRKLKKVLEECFPFPDKVEIRNRDGIIGIITSKRFHSMDTMQRQEVIHDLLATHLTKEERRHVLVIVAVTPEEALINAPNEDL